MMAPNTTSRPQLRRLAGQSKVVAFIDLAGEQAGWIAKGRAGWTGVRAGTAHAQEFLTALAAARFVGGRNA